MTRLGQAIVDLIVHRRRSWLVALLLVLVAGGVIGAMKEATRTTSALDGLPIGAESTAVVEVLQTFPQKEGSSAVVLYAATNGTLDEPTIAALRTRLQGRIAGPLVVSEDKSAAIGVVPVTATGNAGISAAVTSLRTDLKADPPAGVTVQVTGPAAVQADLGAVFQGANTRLLLATAGVVALLLLITYRSPTLWLVPLIVVGIADRLAAVLATHVLKATGVAWDESTIGILSVLVFGAGTDYALLLISRYRDELRREPDRYAAMRAALRHTGEAVLLSATTVVLGVLTLLLSVFPTTRGLGLASAVGIVVAAGYALVVLPAVLVLFGRWVFWPVVPRVGQTALVDQNSFWRKVGDLVAARPQRFVVGTLVVLALMAGGLTQVRSGLSQTDQFLSKPEAIAAAERLAQSFPAGNSDPLVVITEGDPAAVVAAAKSVPSVASATPGQRTDRYAQVAVVLTPQPGTDAARTAVRDVRAAVHGIPGTIVGGTEARGVDAADAASRDRGVIFPIIFVLVLLALLVLLRSVVAPIILVGTVILTFLAAVGASWWIFTKVFGFTALDVGAPLYTFLFLVALGVDYNIFLVTRAREEAAVHGSRAGMLRALSATGGVITSAGVLLAAVFAVLGVLPLVVLAQIGVIICVGVLLDTLVVRTVLVPAIALILGDRFWWPRRVAPVERA
ncbi:MAG TPA: MMPL family transporter [Dermatophilaceae bacterium]|jgi:RND superfamily putative drug exporter|nr:MMPL family transporter [Dermatophilaceae bacterium]HOR16617.1 MMPL family transporter [Dermatophilaceae bacterium]HOV01107.1 MMPL family transporter [Dermatophilaceae bacterium]HQG11306.1 MMPL family transporter [Dermatophilaceae bacterium]